MVSQLELEQQRLMINKLSENFSDELLKKHVSMVIKSSTTRSIKFTLLMKIFKKMIAIEQYEDDIILSIAYPELFGFSNKFDFDIMDDNNIVELREIVKHLLDKNNVK